MRNALSCAITGPDGYDLIYVASLYSADHSDCAVDVILIVGLHDVIVYVYSYVYCKRFVWPR